MGIHGLKSSRKQWTAFLAVWLLFSASMHLLAAEELPQLFVPDGQLLSRPIEIYVSSTNLSQNMNPVLRLVGFYPPGRNAPDYTEVWKPYFVAGGQTWSENVSGQTISRTGSFLLFDLSRYRLGGLKSTARFTPILSWQGSGANVATNDTVVVGNSVYLGSRLMASVWTILTIGALAISIGCLCNIKAKQPKDVKQPKDAKQTIHKLTGVSSLISGPDNYMSLWRTQLVAWTLAVGSMVFFFGVIQLQVPDIPDSLVALMGMSVVTGGLSTIASRANQKPGTAPAVSDPDHKPQFSDLISSYNVDLKLVVLSVPKAQMLFWTGIILILFVTKSILTGRLWDVPWEMVALTGVSQAGYVSDKALQTKPAT